MNYIYSLFLFSSLVLAQESDGSSEDTSNGEEGSDSENRPGDVDVKEDMSSQSMEQKGLFIVNLRTYNIFIQNQK